MPKAKMELLKGQHTPPGGAALFTVNAPLQAYAARMMMNKFKGLAIKESRLITEYVEAKFARVKHQKGGQDYKILAVGLLKNAAFKELLLLNSQGIYSAWEWAYHKANAATELFNYGLRADPGCWPMSGAESGQYADIDNNLTFPGRVIDFLANDLKSYRLHRPLA
jgi:hypothetical protein